MAEGTSEVILSWNVTNWVTVLLMATIGFFGAGLLQRWYKNRQGG